MKRKIGKFLITIGVVCILAALSLFAYNQYDNYRASQSAQTIEKQIEEDLDGKEKKKAPSISDPNKEMLTTWIDGYEYVGTITIPAIDVNLPVLKSWSDVGMTISPALYYGTCYQDNMIICAHNYPSYFNQIRYLEAGAQVLFTDMEGVVWEYSVVYTETLMPTEVQELIDQETKDWDLALFTCNPMGRSRCVVRCERVIG